MPDDNSIANILGTIGTILWCIQLTPQIWKNYKEKDTDGLPAAMILIWAISSIPFGAYAIVQDFAIPLIVEPQMFASLAIITYAQILYYDRKYSIFQSCIAVVGLHIGIGAAEAATVFLCEYLSRKRTTWHLDALALFAAILFAMGFVPAVVEIYRRGGRVAGISFGFLLLDCGGALFSVAALAFQKQFDLDGAGLYVLVVVIEVSIALSHVVWLWRTRDLHRKAAALGTSFDELPEAAPYQGAKDKRIEEDEERVSTRTAGTADYGTLASAE